MLKTIIAYIYIYTLIIVNVNFFVSGDSLQCTPLDRAYKSKVLGHYPDSVPWNPFDEHAVCMVC